MILLEAVERIPTAAIFHYNLACYECLLGDAEVSKARLQHAFKLEPAYRMKALEDEDFGGDFSKTVMVLIRRCGRVNQFQKVNPLA